VADFSELPAADQEAIGKTLLTLLKAFDDRDAEALRGVYSADADWVNAFGTVKRGRDEIVDYLRGLFGDANFNRGELAGPPQTSFRVLTPETVLVSAHLQVKGQGLVGGETLDRDNFSLRALQRQGDGSWLIVSEMFSDANTETTYAH
ncbi:Ketosteroid isomerase-related protein, partial [Mycobacterium rhizamassiliense]